MDKCATVFFRSTHLQALVTVRHLLQSQQQIGGHNHDQRAAGNRPRRGDVPSTVLAVLNGVVVQALKGIRKEEPKKTPASRHDPRLHTSTTTHPVRHTHGRQRKLTPTRHSVQAACGTTQRQHTAVAAPGSAKSRNVAKQHQLIRRVTSHRRHTHHAPRTTHLMVHASYARVTAQGVTHRQVRPCDLPSDVLQEVASVLLLHCRALPVVPSHLATAVACATRALETGPLRVRL